MKNVFTDPAERAADQKRRETLRAQRDALGLTNAALATELSRVSGLDVDYWTVRSWLAEQSAKRARGCPPWTIRMLAAAHGLDKNEATRSTPEHARQNVNKPRTHGA
jgi:hypothetical protein